jgi:hypothetical protein
MIEPLDFNNSVPYSCKYEGAIPLVRTGTIQTSPLESFCNALLLSCSKKFIISEENDKHTSIQKLMTDFKIEYRECPIFTTFFATVSQRLTKLYEDFFMFLRNANTDIDPSLSKLLQVVFEDDDNSNTKKRIDYFVAIDKDILSIVDFRKVLTLQKQTVENLDEMKSNLLHDFKQYIKFKIDNTDLELSRILQFNAIFLIDSMFDVMISTVDVPDFNPNKTCDIMYAIASNHFHINIFILRSKDDKIIYSNNDNYDSNRKSVILLSFEDNIFEVVGKLRQGDFINRQFLPYEDVIQSMRYYLRPKNPVPLL